MNIVIKPYSNDIFQDVYTVVHETIEKVYPKYYPREAVDFFHDHHSFDNMKEDIPGGTTLVAFSNDKLIGTGSLVENEIKRMFVLPDEHSRGCGGILLKELEMLAQRNELDEVYLHASLGAHDFYARHGYMINGYEIQKLPADYNLCYFIMHKNLYDNEQFTIDYNNRRFTSVSNSDNGEVDSNTIFTYFQKMNCIWADYSGGKIIKGFLLGKTNKEGELSFSYCHLNNNQEICTGECISSPEVLSGGRIRLHEKWKWTCGDFSEGESIIEEIK